MIYLPSSEMWQEILKTTHLVRVAESASEHHSELTFVVRCDSLRLKYIAQQPSFALALFSCNRVLCYAMRIDDGEESPFMFWSAVQSQAELTSFHRLLVDRKTIVHLYNEACVQVASVWATVELPTNALELIARCTYLRGDLSDIEDAVSKNLNAQHDYCLAIFHRQGEWIEVDAIYITNSTQQCRIKFLTGEEGRQQEQLLRWLADDLSPDGAYLNPYVREPSGEKEFTDLILTSDHGTFIFMSKTLAIFARKNLPTRAKLSSDILKVLKKDARKIKNQCGKLHAGESIFDFHTKLEIDVNRELPVNAICIVPDLSLISRCRDYGPDFARSFATPNRDLFHALDPTQLFRTMQAAHMLSQKLGIEPLEAFSSYLALRNRFALEHDVLDFDMTLNLNDAEPRIRFSVKSH